MKLINKKTKFFEVGNSSSDKKDSNKFSPNLKQEKRFSFERSEAGEGPSLDPPAFLLGDSSGLGKDNTHAPTSVASLSGVSIDKNKNKMYKFKHVEDKIVKNFLSFMSISSDKEIVDFRKKSLFKMLSFNNEFKSDSGFIGSPLGNMFRLFLQFLNNDEFEK